jgi:hypothetical protein
MEETVFVYMNLNMYTVVVNGPFGGPLPIPRNKAVKGDYFARFAQPQGSLAMMPEHLVAPHAIICDIKPPSPNVAAVWAQQKDTADPALFSGTVPAASAASGATAGDTSIVSTPGIVMTPPPAPQEEIVVGDTVILDDATEEVVTAVEGDEITIDDPSTAVVEEVKVSKKRTKKKK